MEVDKQVQPKEASEDAMSVELGAVSLFDDNSPECQKLLRKIDWYLMPMMCLLYAVQFLDKTALSYASVMGIKTDTHLVRNQYADLGTIFYVGYLFWEYPTSYLMQRFPLAKYLSLNVVIWGAVLATTAACKDWAGLMLVRTFLGIFESTVTPGFVLITAQWYKRTEQPLRIGLWYSFNGWALIFGGLFAFGVAEHVGGDINASLKGWQIVFLFTGCFTVVLGVVLFFYLPDNPSSARWLSPAERTLAIERTRENQQAVENKTVKWKQVVEALADVNTWLYALFACATNIPNGAIGSFGSIIITGLGYSPKEALLYGTPTGAVEILWISFFSWLATRTNQRLYCAFGAMIVPLLGLVLLAAKKGSVGLAGYWLVYGYPVASVLFLSLISGNVAGYFKKVTVNAIYLIFYCIGNLIGPQTFQAKDAPDYLPAKIVMVICFGICMADILLIRYLYVKENTRRDRCAADASQAAENFFDNSTAARLDTTDRENLNFRYSL